MKTALLITRSDDHLGVDAVAAGLRARGVRPLRVDTDRYPTDVQVSTRLSPKGTQRRWSAGGVVVDGGDVSAVWYRRFLAGGGLPPSLGDLLAPSIDESRRALYGAIAALGHDVDVRHMDRLEDVRRCDHKELQLVRARDLGLSVPQTLFTNDADAAAAFVDDVNAAGREVVTKMQSSFAVVRDGLEHVVFTSVVDAAARADLFGLRFCPMQFQERIAKKLELRATVVGDDVFCAAVDSAAHGAATQVDWRKDGVGLLKKWTPYALPAATTTALLSLVRSFGLAYAAADFIVTDDDDLVFLEINAGGEWHWLDASVDGSPRLPIADAIAAWLAR